MRLPVFACIALLAATPAWAADPQSGLAPQVAIDRDRQVLSETLNRLLTDRASGAQKNILDEDRRIFREARDQLRVSMNACRQRYTREIAQASASKIVLEPVPCQ